MTYIVVIGGGPAGFFSAIHAKTQHPEARVVLLEKSAVLLAKVRVSGGGRCNVTHSQFDPKALTAFYPRGHKELLGPFHRFQPRDVIQWFESRGVSLKTESDGRMFPTTDCSETIIQALLDEAKKLGIEIRLRQRVEKISRSANGFTVDLAEGTLEATRVILATGSSSAGHALAHSLGHTIQPSVPSLFTFNIPSSPLKELSGVSVDPVELSIGTYRQKGPLLITHFGFSGPAALKLSAWGARFFHEKEYRVDLYVNWLPEQKDLLGSLLHRKKEAPQRTLGADNPFRLPRELWKTLIGDLAEKRHNDLSLKEIRTLAEKLRADCYSVDGKTTHKEEFVTCGGIALNEVDFRSMQSKICPGLFFAGEVLDIDGVTGGFNFQNCWTGGFLAGSSC